jgi:parallel beta-helix repeat protein
MPKGGVVCFALAVVSGPSASFYYNVGGGCTDVIETEGTTPPLSVFRRNGVYLQLTGAEGTVTPGWSIQAAIDAAVLGETVSVGPGTYNESIRLKSGVNVIGAGFSSTILKDTGTTNVVTADGVTNARLAGFQITNSGTDPQDAGVHIIAGSVLVDNNWIIGNHDGIEIDNGSSSIIRNNIIEQNGPAGLPTKYGILCVDSPALIADNLVVSNAWYGVALFLPRSSGAQLINNTIVGNGSVGIWCSTGVNALLKNNIVTGNGGGILVYAPSTPALSYNDVWNNSSFNYSAVFPGPGDISSDPLFDAASPSRYALAAASPCLHAGDPNPMFNNPDGTRNTMGAYGGPGASTSSLFISLTSGFLFNSIGSIPASSISTALPRAGLANVDAATSAALLIPAWEDAPFGGLVQLHGLFGSSDTAIQYYQILAAKWTGDTRPGPADFVPVLDPLSKIKYTIGTNGLVNATLVSIGPDANGLYFRTDRPDSGYWTSPDLKLLLNTLSLQNARYDFICRAYATNDLSSLVTLSSNSLSRVTLWVDNNPVLVNLISVLDQNTNAISECGIIQVATNRQNVQFEFTAYHSSGFLHSYYLASYYGRNRFGGYIAADQYAGSHDAQGRFGRASGRDPKSPILCPPRSPEASPIGRLALTSSISAPGRARPTASTAFIGPVLTTTTTSVSARFFRAVAWPT